MLGRVLRPILAILFVALAIWQTKALMATLADNRSALDIDTAKVEEGPFEVGMTREGVLGSAEETTVRVPEMLMWQSLLTWVIPDGTKVTKGQVVAKLDVSQFRFEVDGQRLQYQQALGRIGQTQRNGQRDVDQAAQEVDRNKRSVEILGKSLLTETEQGEAQVGYDEWTRAFSETDYQKKMRLRAKNVVPGTDVDQAERSLRAREFALDVSKKTVTQLDAQHQVKTAQASGDIKTAEFNRELAARRIKDSVRSDQERAKQTKQWLDKQLDTLGNSEVKAPISGVVILGQAWDESGRHTIRVGDRVESSVCSITDPTKLRIQVRVEEGSANRLRVGQEVVVTAEGVPGSFQAKVATIGAVAHTVSRWDDPNAEPNQRVFDVSVNVLKVDPKVLRPGIKTKTKFVFSRLLKAVHVPLAAVIRRPGQGEFVYVKRGDQYDERKVTTGERNDESVVVRSGLRAGERVALSDPTKVQPE